MTILRAEGHVPRTQDSSRWEARMAVSRGPAEIIRPDFNFLREVQEQSGQSVASCYRCLQCTASCPVAEAMDYSPDRLIRMVQLGLKEEVTGSKALWLCTGCLTCAERCPNGIDVSAVIDTLRRMVKAEGRAPGEPAIAAFHDSFLWVVKRYGRLHEATLIALLKVKTHHWLADVGAGLRLFVRGKIPLLPGRVRGGDQLSGLFQTGGEADRKSPNREGMG